MRARSIRYLLAALVAALAMYVGERTVGIAAGGLIGQYIGVPLSGLVAVL